MAQRRNADGEAALIAEDGEDAAGRGRETEAKQQLAAHDRGVSPYGRCGGAAYVSG